MKVFSLAGIFMVLVYAVAIDRVLHMTPGIKYVSPLTAGFSVQAGGGAFDAKISALQSPAVLVVAAIAVSFTPKLF